MQELQWLNKTFSALAAPVVSGLRSENRETLSPLISMFPLLVQSAWRMRTEMKRGQELNLGLRWGGKGRLKQGIGGGGDDTGTSWARRLTGS